MYPGDVSEHPREIIEQQRAAEIAQQAAVEQRIAHATDVSAQRVAETAVGRHGGEMATGTRVETSLEDAADLRTQIEQSDAARLSQASDHAAATRLERAEDFHAERACLPEITGFEKASVMSNEDVQRFIAEKIPPEHVNRANLPTIEYDDRYVATPEGTLLGVTHPNPVTGENPITIYRQEPQGSFDRALMEQTLAHEIGHNVHLNLPKSMWNEWRHISTEDLYAGRDRVSDYAWKSMQEDFAESYATYIFDPEHLKDVSPAKYAFMRDRVFAGRVYNG